MTNNSINLYRIPQALAEAFDRFTIDEETGELVGDDEARAAFEAAELAAGDKIEATCGWLASQAADVEAIKAEEARLAARRKAIENRSARVKALLLPAVEALGGKVKGVRFTASIRNVEAIDVIDLAEIPAEFKREKITIDPDKIAIKRAIKAGEEIPGAILVSRPSVSIR